MKLPPVDYARPSSLAEAVALLAAHNGEAKVIAGGQSLMPILAFRLAAPSLLVDIGRLPGLADIAITHNGVTLGALVRWRDIEREQRLAFAHPLLQAAIAHVAHYQIRNRGTVGGSLAHADPAAELPGIAVACDAQIVVTGSAGTRNVAADDFFIGPLTTCLEADEIVTAIRFPAWPRQRRWGFEEFSRRRGDFALAAAAVFYDIDGAGSIGSAHVGVIGCGDRPHRLSAVEDALNGNRLDDALLAQAAAITEATVEAQEDIHATAAYRRSLAGVMVERALRAAHLRADA